MKQICIGFVLAAFFLTACQPTTQQDVVAEPAPLETPEADGRRVQGQLLISSDTPSYNIRVADEFTYVGQFDFEIIADSDEYPEDLQGQPIAAGERFVFAFADKSNAIQKLFIIQYEGFLPENEFTYL